MSQPKRSWFLFSMMLIAANLRLPITLMPPLLPSLEDVAPAQFAGRPVDVDSLVTFAIFHRLS